MIALPAPQPASPLAAPPAPAVATPTAAPPAGQQQLLQKKADSGAHSFDTLDKALLDIAKKLDQYQVPARKAQRNAVVQMYANYENKFYGTVDPVTGQWLDMEIRSNMTAFSVPLLKAHTDTHITFYCKAKPKYEITPEVRSLRYKALANMCEKLAARAYERNFGSRRSSNIQREALHLALATQSYRQVVMEYAADSPVVKVPNDAPPEMMDVPAKQCQACQSIDYTNEATACSCGGAELSDITTSTPRPQEATKSVRLRRPSVKIPNPIAVQDDFFNQSFYEPGFTVKRRKIDPEQAEFLHQVELETANSRPNIEGQTQDILAAAPLLGDQGQMASGTMLEFSANTSAASPMSHKRRGDEIEVWLDPSWYGFLMAGGEAVLAAYPEGLYYKAIGDQIVEKRPAKRNSELVKLTYGQRPGAAGGMGMMPIADLNDIFNNGLNLDYAILMTTGFPTTILRGKYIKKLEVLSNIVAHNVPDSLDLDKLIHRESGSSASGMMGIFTQRIEGLMQFIMGTWTPMGSGSADVRDFMGTATGATAVQEMMNDRLGQPVYSRIEADIETYYCLLEALQTEPLYRHQFLQEFDEATVELFFETNLRSALNVTVVEGTEMPASETANVFKVQSMAQMSANLTGLATVDRPLYLDIVDALGTVMNLPADIGTGRKERKLADERIADIQTIFFDKYAVVTEGDFSGAMKPSDSEVGMKLFVEATQPETELLGLVNAARRAAQAAQTGGQPEVEDMLHANKVETQMYDHAALKEAYSDWLQGSEGQNSPLPIKIAVTLCFAHAMEMDELSKKVLIVKSASVAGFTGAVADTGGQGGASDNPPGALKRDGREGPGRPHDVKVDTPPKEDVE